MKTHSFNVTYEIISADGDADEHDFIAQGVDLRVGLDLVKRTRTSLVGGVICIEPSSYPGNDFDWITISNGMEFETGAFESRSLHLPKHLTPSTRGRILRLIKD